MNTETPISARVSRLLEDGDPVLLFDVTDCCAYANPAGIAAFPGVTGGLVGSRLADGLAEAGEPSLREALREATTTRAQVPVELRHPATGRWLEGRVVPGEDGSALYLHDTTDHRSREVAVLQTRHNLLAATSGGLTGSFTINLENGRTHVSRTVLEMYGLDPSDGDRYPQSVYRALQHPDDRPRVGQALEDVAAHPGEMADITYRIHRADTGEERLVHVLGVVVREAGNTTGTLTGSITDVTELQRAHAAIVASEDRLRRILESVDAIVFFQEHAGAPVIVSPPVLRILGYRPEDMTAFDAWDRLIHPDDIAGCRVAWERADQSWYLRYRIRRADGTWAWIADRGHWNLDADGRPDGLFSIAVDATSAIEAEAALRASEARYRSLSETAHDAILTVDTDGQVVACNPAAERILGYGAVELLGSPVTRIVAGTEVSLISEALARLARGEDVGGSGRPFELRGRRSDGTEIALDVSVATWSLGEEHFLTAIVRDVDERRRAEEAARVADERRRRFFDAGMIGTAILDADGRVLEANGYLLRLLGREREEVEGGTLFGPEVTAPEFVEIDRAAMATALETGVCVPYEKVYIRPDGTRVPALIARARLPGPEPQLASFVLDMSEQHAAREGMARLAAAIEQTSETVIIADLDARMTYVNPAFERVTGYRRDEVIGRNPRMLKSGRQSDADYASMWATLTAGRTWTGELVNRRKDGTLFSEEATISPLRDAEGKVTAYVAVKRDVSAERAAHAALQTSEDRLRQTLEGMDGIIVFQGRPDEPMVVSPQSERILGRPPVGLTSYEAWHGIVHPDDLPAATAAWDGPQGTWDIEYRVRHADGRWIWLADRGRKELDAQGAPVRAISSLVDITARRALETQLRQAQRLEAIGQLAGGVAHDMNNILAAIQGYAAFAADEVPADSRAEEDIRQVLVAAERASTLTRQLLAFSRRQPIAPRAVDLAAVVDGLAPMLRRLLGEHIAVEVEHEPSRGRILADPGQLEQVIVNLAVNGRDAMPAGGRLTIRTSEAPGAGGDHARRCVRLAVADTGVGMDEPTLAHIFEPFFTTKEPGKGTGLGLATVYGIVTGSGGSIDVESQPGAGTVFTIDLPCAGPVDDAGAGSVPAAVSAGRGEHVLVVEDDPDIRAVVGRMLRGLGYKPTVVAGGHEALEAATTAAVAFDVVLTDVRMPGMQGPELVRRLRESSPDLPVVFMTAFAPDLDDGGAPVDAARLIHKPFTSEELGAELRAALDETATGSKP